MSSEYFLCGAAVVCLGLNLPRALQVILLGPLPAVLKPCRVCLEQEASEGFCRSPAARGRSLKIWSAKSAARNGRSVWSAAC